MRKLLPLILFIFPLILFLNGNAQITVHGFISNGNPDHLIVGSLDAYTGQVLGRDTIRKVNAYALGSSTYDDFNQYFMFTGVDTNYNFRYVSWNLKADTIEYDPLLQGNVNDVQYDMNTLKLFGLSSYIVDSTEIMGGQYMYEYAMSFVELDQQTGTVTEYNQIPELRAIPVGSSTFDANNGRYLVNGLDENNSSKLFIIDSDNGQVISNNPIILGPNEYINELEYNNNDDKLYGLYRDLGAGVFRIASVDVNTSDITPILDVPDLQYFVQGASVFHQFTQTFILYYIDTNNVSRLLLADVANGTITGTPQIPSYFTELEVDNNQFAMLAYHTSTDVGEQRNLSSVKIFPNPVSDFLNIENNGNDGKVQLFNTSGQIVFSKKLTTGEKYSFPVSGLRAGSYILWFIEKDSTHFHKVIVK
jgi:hypothetical protein